MALRDLKAERFLVSAPRLRPRSDSPVPVHVKNEPQKRTILGPIWERTWRDSLFGGADRIRTAGSELGRAIAADFFNFAFSAERE